MVAYIRRYVVYFIKPVWELLFRPMRYRLNLKYQRRENRTYTQFYRFPSQYRVLTDHILPTVDQNSFTESQPLDILVFASSTGAEVYSLIYVIKSFFPELNFRIRAFDIVESVVNTARLATYSSEEVHAGPFVTDAFINDVFDETEGVFKVKPSLTHYVSFGLGDMLDEQFMQSLGACDLLFAQNVLFHLDRPLAVRAFKNLVSLLKPNAFIFINGMDTDMRVSLTQKYDLEPLMPLIEDIHNDARVDRGVHWDKQYWGREPFSNKSKDWVRKFGTIYSKGQ